MWNPGPGPKQRGSIFYNDKANLEAVLHLNHNVESKHPLGQTKSPSLVERPRFAASGGTGPSFDPSVFIFHYSCTIHNLNFKILEFKVDVSWVFPGPIDINKLKVALAKSLHDYPHAAGRLSYDENLGRWLIKLTNEAVPIILGKTNLVFSEELMRMPHPDIVESTPFVLQQTAIVDLPLVKLKLVEWENEDMTSLSLSFHHSLG
jgi:hypothetical protein